MKACLGDRLVLAAPHPGSEQRIGVIVGVSKDGGPPPYTVRWLDSGYVTLILPGPHAHIEPHWQAGGIM